MNGLIDAAVNRSRTSLLLMAMVFIAGFASLRAIPIESEPNITVPFFQVMVFNEGISPEDAERLLVMPMEVELRSLEGIEEMTSYATENYGIIVIEFDADQDVDEALVDIRQAIDRARAELPSTAEEPTINEQTTADFPILQINFVGDDVPERMLYHAALGVRNAIEGIPDVMTAELQGEREEVLEAIIDPIALEAYQISGEDLIRTIARNNRLVPAGSLDTGEGRFSLKVPSIIETAVDLYDLPVKSSAEAVITLKDVATIRRSFKDRTSYARVNGRRAISVNVIKRADANIIDTVHAAKAMVEQARPNLSGKIDIFYTQDQAPFALLQINELQGNILTALALVMIIVVAAMGLRSGLIVGLGIPMSLLFALSILYVIGFTYNFMVMMGMLLALGMLIDGSIVVTEYADRRMLKGDHRQVAYATAAKRMFWPVTASIATTLAAFLPLMFWPGLVGKFMRYLPITVFAVLAGSLMYSLFFGPAVGAILGQAGADQEQFRDNLDTLETGDPRSLPGVVGNYAKILWWCSRSPWITLLATLSILVASFMAYSQYGKGVIFYSDAEPQYASLDVKSRGNMSAVEINALVTEVENIVVNVNGIAAINTWTRLPGGGSRGASDRIGTIFIELLPEGDRARSARVILEEIRSKTSQLAGFTIEIDEMQNGPPQGKPIQVQLTSYNRNLLEPALKQIRAYMDNVQGLRDIEDTQSLPGLEWQLAVDRAQAALFGADVSSVGLVVQLVTAGIKIGEYRPDRADDAVDIRVRYPQEYRGIRAIDELKVSTQHGMVPISNFVVRKAVANVDTFQRTNGIPVEFIRANVMPNVLADDKVKEMQAWLKNQAFDADLDITFRGANEDQQESQAFVLIAFGLSLLLMFVLLVTQFNSFYQSGLILFAVVMSTAGVLLGLLITGRPFSSLLTGIGIVALAGIVVNNNIVLIDTFNHLRKAHPDADYIQLIIRTGTQRLRPVILTTLTTIFGLLPLAMNFSIDLLNRTINYGSMLSSMWVPLSQAIVSGMAFASILTLVTTPALLALPFRIKEQFAGFRKPTTAKET